MNREEVVSMNTDDLLLAYSRASAQAVLCRKKVMPYWEAWRDTFKLELKRRLNNA